MCCGIKRNPSHGDGSQGIPNELVDRFGPSNNVDVLSRQLAYDRSDANPSFPNTGTYGINTAVS
jgi:hypothetical protein